MINILPSLAPVVPTTLANTLLVRGDRLVVGSKAKSEHKDIFADSDNLIMAHRKGNKTHSYSAQRSGSKKYAKTERRKRNKPKA